MTTSNKEENKDPSGGAVNQHPKNHHGKRFKAMSPNRTDTYRGLYIPVWLLELGLDSDAVLMWAVMARCAGKSRRLQGFSRSRLGDVIGMPPEAARKAVAELERAGVVEHLHLPGKSSVYAFREPVQPPVSWTGHLRKVDAGTDEYWI